jgi:hypothetical protein
MADDLTNKGAEDRSWINMSEDGVGNSVTSARKEFGIKPFLSALYRELLE